MQGKACAMIFVAAMMVGCADTPSRQAQTPAAREKAAATGATQVTQAPADDRRVAAPKVAGKVREKPRPHSAKRAERPSDDAVYVTLTTTWSEPETRTADSGGSGALPVRGPGQREGVFASPLSVTGLEDPTVF